MKYYQNRIREIAAQRGFIGIDPRHIEAYMRLGHSTLDGLSARQFEREVILGAECTLADGQKNAERCAKSFGL